MIPRELSAIFPLAVRSRGQQYLPHVRIATNDATSISAVVRGTRHYAVEIDAAEGTLGVSCMCPYSAQHGICKHAWAVLCVADASDLLAPLLRTAGPGASYWGVPLDEVGQRPAPDDQKWLDDRLREARGSPRPPARNGAGTSASKPPAVPEWKRFLKMPPRARPSTSFASRLSLWPEDRRIIYIIDLTAPSDEASVAVTLLTEGRRPDGTWTEPRPFRAPLATWLAAPDPTDRQLVQMLAGAGDSWTNPAYPHYPYGAAPSLRTTFSLAAVAFETVLPLLCATRRCFVRLAPGEEPRRIDAWDNGGAWSFALRVDAGEAATPRLSAVLTRGDERIAFAPPLAAHQSGLVVAGQTLSRAKLGGAFSLAADLYRRGHIAFAAAEMPEVLDALFSLPGGPSVDLGAGCSIAQRADPPEPCLSVSAMLRGGARTARRAELRFRYGSLAISPTHPTETIFDAGAKTLFTRDLAAEARAEARLRALGGREERQSVAGDVRWVIPDAKWLACARSLGDEGWRVEIDGIANRPATGTRAELRSGIDWFELDASVQYGDETVSLHTLLDAEQGGQAGVPLEDGSVGLLPLQWLDRWRTIAAGGKTVEGMTRFTRAQTALLDALIESMPEVGVDATFEKARAELRRFDRIEPAEPPRDFRGALREYQKAGLGWLHFLRKFGLGGCLADDMGLGKTVQVLALLDGRRAARDRNGPSIAVVPRSLVHNWISEAERFAPSLRVLDFSTPGRGETLDLSAVDLLITTYGILRREAPRLSTIEFDYAILDEAQAIKNATTASAKAARLLRASHRLAVTGTPVENRLEELWSIMEFLNHGRRDSGGSSEPPGPRGSDSNPSRGDRRTARAPSTTTRRPPPR